MTLDCHVVFFVFPLAVPTMAEEDELFEPRIVCGLSNLGNTCYFNSGLQLLASATPFVSALAMLASSVYGDGESTARHAGLHPFHSPSRAALVQATVQTLQDMYAGTVPAVAPRSLLSHFCKLNPQFHGLHQQDCPEMITGLLSQLEDEVKVEVCTSEVLRELSTAAPSSHSSQRFLAAMKLVDQVNNINAAEEVEMQHKQGKLQYTLADHRPPRWIHSYITDCFRGAMLHEIHCSQCCYISRTVDEFTSLTLEIPSARQRRAFAERHPNIVRYDAEGCPLNEQSSGKSQRASYRWWNPIRYVSALCSFMYACVVGDEGLQHPLTLEECLDIHFDAEVLGGSNKYRCPKCKQHVDAVKRHSLLWCPEVLMIHLKRFEVGAYWTSKRDDPIIFPAGHSGTKWQRPLDLSMYETASIRSANSKAPPYELSGVVNHHGSFGGGHYTAYANKGAQLGWIMSNDASIKRVDVSEVVDSQEYMLMYRKRQPDVPDENTEEAAVMQLARNYMRGTAVAREPSVMVRKSWLHRVATYVEPGPLMNRTCYCAGSQLAEHYHGTVCDAYMALASQDYARMAACHGGPELDQLPTPTALKSILSNEAHWLRRKC